MDNMSKEQLTNDISFEEFRQKTKSFLELLSNLYEDVYDESDKEFANEAQKTLSLLKYDILSNDNLKNIYDMDLAKEFLDQMELVEKTLEDDLNKQLANKKAEKEQVEYDIIKNQILTDVVKEEKNKYKKALDKKKEAYLPYIFALITIFNSTIGIISYDITKPGNKYESNSTSTETESDYDYESNEYVLMQNNDYIAEMVNMEKLKAPYSESVEEVSGIDIVPRKTDIFRFYRHANQNDNVLVIVEYSMVLRSGYRTEKKFFVIEEPDKSVFDYKLSEYIYNKAKTVPDTQFSINVIPTDELMAIRYNYEDNNIEVIEYSKENDKGIREKRTRIYSYDFHYDEYIKNHPKEADKKIVIKPKAPKKYINIYRDEKQRKITENLVEITKVAIITFLIQFIILLIAKRKKIHGSLSEYHEDLIALSKYKANLKELLSEYDKNEEKYKDIEREINSLCNRIDKTIIYASNELNKISDKQYYTKKFKLKEAKMQKEKHDEKQLEQKENKEEIIKNINVLLAALAKELPKLDNLDELDEQKLKTFLHQIYITPSVLFEEKDDHFVIRKEYIPYLRFFDLSIIVFDNVDVRNVDFRWTNAVINPEKVYKKDLTGIKCFDINIMDFKDYTDVILIDAEIDENPKSMIHRDKAIVNEEQLLRRKKITTNN